MIDGAEIVANLVALLRDIPDLVEAMGGDEANIAAYEDRYPAHTSLDLATYKMPAPGMLVAWQGAGPGSFGDFEVWKHEISIRARAGEDSGDVTPSGYYRILRLVTKGVPSSGTQEMQYLTVHASCQPMDTPSFRRQTDQQGVDYFEVSLFFTEIGDD